VKKKEGILDRTEGKRSTDQEGVTNLMKQRGMYLIVLVKKLTCYQK